MPTVNFYFSDEPESMGYERTWLAVPRIGDKVEILTVYPGDSMPRREKAYVAGIVRAGSVRSSMISTTCSVPIV